MSDYKYVKVIRYKNDLLLGELLPYYVYGNNYQDLIDNIMKSHPEYSENPMYRKFRLGCDACDDYIDFVLAESYGERYGEWYQTARLTDEEFKEYQKLFSEFLNVPQESIKTLCKVEYYISYTDYEPAFIAYEKYDYSTEDEQSKEIAQKKGENNMNKISTGAEFGKYKHYTYRICYGLTKEGRIDYSNPHYEFIKHCRCVNCQNRLKYDRFPTNSLTVTTDDKSKFPEIERILDEYVCDENVGRKYISFINGKREERTDNI